MSDIESALIAGLFLLIGVWFRHQLELPNDARDRSSVAKILVGLIKFSLVLALTFVGLVLIAWGYFEFFFELPDIDVELPMDRMKPR